MDRLLIESSNFWGLLVAGFAAWRVVIWKTSNHLSLNNDQIVGAWILIVMSVAFNRGWFAASRHLAPEGEIFNPAMLEWRWLVVFGTAVAFAWGILKFVRLIDGYGLGKQVLLFAGSFALAIGLGFY